MNAIEIFKELIGERLTPLIVKYDPYKDGFTTHPYRHVFDDNFERIFTDIIFDSIIFYAYEKDEIEKEYQKGIYEPLPLPQAIETCKELVRMFADKKIDIIRVGLQSTDEIADPSKEKSEVVAGPYHPAFRQLVESAMWYDAIVGKIKKLNVKVKEVEVKVNPIDANNVIGHKKENVRKLKEYYDVDLILKQDESIKQGKSKIEVTKTFKDFAYEEREEEKKEVSKK